MSRNMMDWYEVDEETPRINPRDDVKHIERK